MDRHDLETRLRRSLAEEADTIVATPDLWERVADGTVRRSRWRSPVLWRALATTAAAAAAAIVIGVFVLPGLDTPPSQPVIADPPTSSRPTTAPDTTGGIADRATTLVVARDEENSIGGFGGLYAADPGTGEVIATLDEGQPERDAPAYESLAVRPGGSGELAALLAIEGQWDLRLIEGDGATAQAFVADASFGEADQPRVAWSQDGAYLLWTGTPDGGGTVLYLLDVAAWRASAVVDDPFGAIGFAQSFPIGAPGATVELLDVVGIRGGELVVTALANASRLIAQLMPTDGCSADDCTYESGGELPVPADDAGLIDLADTDLFPGNAVGPEYVLLQDPDGTLRLEARGEGDFFATLELPPELQSAGTSQEEAWLDATGSTVLVGRGGRAWLLTVDLFADPAAVIETIEVSAGVATGALGRELSTGPNGSNASDGSDSSDASPTASGETSASAGVLDPRVTVARVGTDQLEIAGSFGDAATVERPVGLDAEPSFASAVIQPGAPEGRAGGPHNVVDRSQPDPCPHRGRVGEVVANEVLGDDAQASGSGGILETPDTTPRFDPAGRYLLWNELAPDGGYLLIAQPWIEGAPVAGRVEISVEAAREVAPVRVVAVSRSGEDLIVHQAAWQPGPSATEVSGLLRTTVSLDASGELSASSPSATSFVALDGVLVAGGATSNGVADDAVGLVSGPDGATMIRLETPSDQVVLGAEVEAADVLGVTDDGLLLRPGGGEARRVAFDGSDRAEVVPAGLVGFLAG